MIRRAGVRDRRGRRIGQICPSARFVRYQEFFLTTPPQVCRIDIEDSVIHSTLGA